MTSCMRKSRTTKDRNSEEWRKFELLVAAVEEYLVPRGATIKSPDWIKDADTNQEREVDASIRFQIENKEMLITVECRDRSTNEDVTWVEQLATKRLKVGAVKTIAVSAKGFSESAQLSADKYGIELKVLSKVEGVNMNEWFAPVALVYPHNRVGRFTCRVKCQPDIDIVVDAEENRFRHPLVQTDIFPGAAFLGFIKEKDPGAFMRTIRKGDGEFELTLTGGDSVPDLSGDSRTGQLECLHGGKFHVVDTISLKFKIDEKVELLEPRQGNHYAYGAPKQPTLAFSQFEGETGSVPIRIEHLTNKAGESISSVSFPGSPRIPVKTLNPRITDISKIDTDLLHRQPIGLKVKSGEYYEGELFRPQKVFFKSQAQQLEFNRTHLIFMEKSDLVTFQNAVATNPSGRMFYELVRVYARDQIEYVDLMPLLKAISSATQAGR